MIGWYVHHHGQGHLSRARAVAPHLDEVRILGSIDAPDVHALPLDIDLDGDPDPVSTDYLHHAPLGVPGLTSRMAELARWIDHARPDLFVVDVSVEVATFVRLMGIPTVVMRQHGRRDDVPHTMAAHHASALLAPFDETLEDPWVPGWLRRRTRYTGGFSQMDDRPVDPLGSRRRLGIDPCSRLVVMQAGAEGAYDWVPEEADTPGWDWVVLGPSTPTVSAGQPPGVVRRVGWQADPWDWLCAADVVVTHAGHNSVMETAAARRPMIVIPRERPFGEQRHKAAALARVGAAIVRPGWPDPQDWAALLDRASAFLPDVALVDRGGAQRMAKVLRSLTRATTNDAGRPRIVLA